MASTTNNNNNNKVLSPQRLAHLVFRTANYKPMVSFYKAFLGAHAAAETDGLAFLTYDDEHHRVAIAHMPGTTPKSPTAAGLDHVAFTFGSLADLLTAYTQRRAYGIAPVWCCHHGITVSLYYQDPDGNRIETQVDAMTPDEATALMTSPAFAENPIGVDFDPDELVRRLAAGEDEAALLQRIRDRSGPRGVDSVPVAPPPDVRDVYELLAAGACGGGG